MENQAQLFPSIGSVAASTGNQELASSLPVDDEHSVQEIESLCMNCHEQGVTRLLLTSIPYFREVIIASFKCDHCGNTNNEIQSAGDIRPEGSVYTARILSRDDLDRQVVKSPTCTVVIPEFELTIPALRGQLTTVEGLVRDVISDLSGDQPLRRYEDEKVYARIQLIIDGLQDVLQDEVGQARQHTGPAIPFQPFTLKLDDPAGNSFIEFLGSMADPKWNMRTYHRSQQQNVELGLIAPDSEQAAGPENVVASFSVAGESEVTKEDRENEEIFIFSGVCSSCGHPLDTLMKKVVIPYFKDILIMSTNCDACGYRDNEVKSGSAISEGGKRITLKVEDRDDLSRDILKSETCGMSIPEIDLVLQAGTLGGRFTTLEGILDQVYEELSTKVFASGDANTHDDRHTFEVFLKSLKEVKGVERPFTIILDDPLANSYLQNLYAPDPDPNMETVTYTRTFEQNEELGLNDMKVEGYENDA